MTRALLLGLALLATACGKKTPGESVCENTVPPPEACNTPCDPAPGAPNACPSGYHCSADGKCDASCTVGGGQCGTGFECTSDGLCVDDGSGSGDPPIDAEDCPAVRLTATKVTPVVQLLLDQSSSMDADYPNDGDPRRWDAMITALVDDQDGIVKKLGKSVIFGASLYSNRSQLQGTGPNARQVGIQPCPTLISQPRVIDNFGPIAMMLNRAAPVEDTPTAESIDAIVQDFADNPPADPNAPKIIVLATDGLPDTCADADPPADSARQNAASAASVAAAQEAFRKNIRLFFLFIGDDAAGNHPKQMANAGAGKDPLTGDEQPFVATNSAALNAAFESIIGSVVPCDVKLSRTVSEADAPSGMVTINGAPIAYNTDWTLDPDGLTIRLKTAACDRLQAAPNPTIEAVFPCGTIIF